MSESLKYVDVVLPLKSGFFTYNLPVNVDVPSVGYSVIVPFRNQIYSGIVIAVHNRKPDFKTRQIISIPARNPVLALFHLRFWNWIAEYYFCSIGEVIDAALPPLLKIKKESDISFSGNEKYKPLIESKYSFKKNLMTEAVVFFQKSPQKKRVIEFFNNSQNQSFTIAEIVSKTDISKNIVRQTVSTKYFECENFELSRINDVNFEKRKEIIFSEFQNRAFNDIQKFFSTSKPVLLWGVTGSGKTEIYIKLIEETLKEGKQALYLLPEIIISSQIIKRLQSYFGNEVCIYHSKINQSLRAEIWHNIFSGNKLKIVVGPRSSIFLPFRNLGLIIVDEEHDTNYKQQEPSPRYQARDAAIILAKITNAKILLGSATPSLESLYNVKNEKYNLVKLEKRFGDSSLPVVEIVDYRKFYRRREVVGHLTPLLKESIEKALQHNEQVILLQNRRGEAPFVQCKSCGYVPKCKNCDISLTSHKTENKLICHYCGYKIVKPEKCPSCSADILKSQGFGTEKVEEELKNIFPLGTIARLDSDTASSRLNYEDILSRFDSGEIDILIGTQMVTKGLDFNRVNLVGVLNADNLLSFADFRALERAFQMLMQFAGRAGRRKEQGKIIIQTSQPEHPVIQFIKNQTPVKFYEQELNERLQFHYPPFVRLIKLTVKHYDKSKTEKAAEILLKLLSKAGINNVLGP